MMKDSRILKAKIIEQFGSQWRFAQAIGVHESMVSKAIHGRRPLDEATKKEWAEVLKCDSGIFDIG